MRGEGAWPSAPPRSALPPGPSERPAKRRKGAAEKSQCTGPEARQATVAHLVKTLQPFAEEEDHDRLGVGTARWQRQGRWRFAGGGGGGLLCPDSEPLTVSADN